MRSISQREVFVDALISSFPLLPQSPGIGDGGLYLTKHSTDENLYLQDEI